MSERKQLRVIVDESMPDNSRPVLVCSQAFFDALASTAKAVPADTVLSGQIEIVVDRYAAHDSEPWLRCSRAQASLYAPPEDNVVDAKWQFDAARLYALLKDKEEPRR